MVLVTGGTGLLGAHLLYRLASAKMKVRALTRLLSNIQRTRKIFSYYCNNPDELIESIDWVEGDISDLFALSDALENVTQVYHCAAYVSFSKKNKSRMFNINVNGTANLVNLLLTKENIKLMHVSSIAALGVNQSGKAITEETRFAIDGTNSLYSLSKYFSELEVWRGITEGLNAVIVNPSVIIGPGNWDSGSALLFHTIAKKMKYYTNGTSGYVGVEDVVSIMLQLMESECKDEQFIISSENLDYETFFSLISDSLNNQPPSKQLTPQLVKLAYFGDTIISFILNREPKLTKSAIRTIFKKLSYSNEKIISQLNYKYTPIANTVEKVSRFYMSDHDN